LINLEQVLAVCAIRLNGQADRVIRTVKIKDEYKTQTDNSDSPSEKKRTNFTNTRHINPELKILMHSQQQLKSKISYDVLKTINRSEWASPMFTVSKTYQTLRSIADLKEVNKKIVTKRIQS
jgi:hypothetical protein